MVQNLGSKRCRSSTVLPPEILFFSFTPTDHLIQAYALVSIVLDMFLYPKNS